ncbi:MAG TPA: SIMPL domain-containing protein [Gemmatimonadaceae bacterium]|nr:SIMPL domain-containing protein [Gemmatimonadaceae bacterium]
MVATGVGEARVVPDRATIFIGVQSRASTAAAAAADNARRERAVEDTLRALGLGDGQLSTSNYSVSPEMQYAPGGQARVTGYTVSNTVRVDVRRIDDIGKLIDGALAKGSNNISGLQFHSSKADSVRRVALAEAVAAARGDAEAMARAAGGSLGGLVELSTESTPTPRLEMAMARSAGASVAPTQIDPGVQTISVTVATRWSFTPR